LKLAVMRFGLTVLLTQPFAVMTAAAGCDAVANCTLGGTAENVLSGTDTIPKGGLAMSMR
jgi:hypothetical protein